MLSSAVIDIAVGLVFIYLLLSLICTIANETIANVVSLNWNVPSAAGILVDDVPLNLFTIARGSPMTLPLVNYDGGITTSPAKVIYPESVSDIQAVLSNAKEYPSPVRAMGSYHSLTPCASTDGTIIKMSRMNRIIAIDRKTMTMTAQAGIEFITASKVLRIQNLQFLTNIEIGNMTLGAAACCHTKDGLDGFPLGQVSSYVTEIKWVTPDGKLAQASETNDPELLRRVRSSYGLCGVIYELTFRIKPLEAVRFRYLPRSIDSLSEQEVDRIINSAEGLVCWTLGRTAHFQTRTHAAGVGFFGSAFAASRRFMWNNLMARVGRGIDRYLPSRPLKRTALDTWFLGASTLLRVLSLTGGASLMNPDKTVDYGQTTPSGKYAFTFWTFPRAQWLSALRGYLDFADRHYQRYGFRCNMPLGSYYIRQDSGSLLSYTHEDDMFSIDPIHAFSDRPAWDRFLQEFNEFASKRNGVPLLNQSPFVTRQQVLAAYGRRWQVFCDWVRATDPMERMLNPFFAELLVQRS
jgi:FAD binding domain